MSAKMIFTCDGHERCACDAYPSLPMPGAQHLEVCADARSGFYGFGVAITPSSCYVLAQMDAQERHALLKHLYSKEGLGLSVGRLCVGSSDYSPELYSYDDVAFDVALEHFSVERDGAYVIPIIKEILAINPELYLFASPWSPPYWMKTGGSMCGGYMREQYLDCYADYLVKFIKAYAAHGIKVSALTPQNEPDTRQYGKMAACVWHPELEARFIGILRERLVKNGLDVKIWMYDHNFVDVDRVLWSLENCKGLSDACDGVAFHYYRGAIEQTAAVRAAYPALELHFTEGGPRLADHYDSDFCKWALMIIKAIKVGYRSFTGWNLALDELGGPCVGHYSGICGGLVTRDQRDGSLSYSGQYKAFSHIAPYITPESKLHYVRSDVSCERCMAHFPKRDEPVEGILAENPDGKRVLIAVNLNASCVQAQIEVDGVLYYIELQPNSVATVEFER